MVLRLSKWDFQSWFAALYGRAMDRTGKDHTSIKHFLGPIVSVRIIAVLVAVSSAALFTASYKEQVTWRETATGRIIAQSDFFKPLRPGSLITHRASAAAYTSRPARIYRSAGRAAATVKTLVNAWKPERRAGE
jgi:hypothetical protein